jgi:hypothetical protein
MDLSSDLLSYLLVGASVLIVLVGVPLWLFGRNQRHSRKLLRQLMRNGPENDLGRFVRGEPDAIAAALEQLDERITVRYLVTSSRPNRREWTIYEDWFELAENTVLSDAHVLVLPFGSAVRDFSVRGGRFGGPGFRGEPINAVNCVVLACENGCVTGAVPLSDSQFCQTVMARLARAMRGMR